MLPLCHYAARVLHVQVIVGGYCMGISCTMLLGLLRPYYTVPVPWKQRILQVKVVVHGGASTGLLWYDTVRK